MVALLCLNSRGECFEVASASEVGDADNVGDVSECAPARMFDLTASLDVECDFPAVLS